VRCGESIDSKNSEDWPNKCKLCHFQPTCISLSLTPLLPISKYVKCVTRPIQCTQCYLESSCTSMSLQTIVINSSHKRAKNQGFIYNHRGLHLLNLVYLIMIYFALIYSTSDLTTFINSILKIC